MRSFRQRVPAWLTAGRLRWYVAGGLAAGLLAIVLVVLLLPGDPEPRERRYRDVTACLLTDGDGLAGKPAAAVWAGMQEASLQTQAKVQYLSVPGEQTARNATLYLNSLGQSGCVVVFAVGDAPIDGISGSAPHFPDVRFVAVGRHLSATGNVSSVELSSDEALRAAVKQLVADEVGPADSN